MDEEIMIDIEQLRADLKQEVLGAFCGGGFEKMQRFST